MIRTQSSPAIRASASAVVALGLLGGTAASAATLSNVTVAFLMPDQSSTRYEEHDHPGFVAEMKKLCPTCKVLYQNADGDASRQQQQFNSVVSQGAKAIVLDPVDSTAAASLVHQAQAQGIKVIAYDRPIPSAKADYYVSFNNEAIGKMIASSLVEHLKAMKVPTDGGLLEVNGSPTDAAAGLIKKGMHAGIATGGYATLAEYDTPEWAPSKAQQWVSGQISRFQKKIVGVVAANDGTAGGTVAAFKAAGVDPVPAVSGNDATIAGLQLIISGDQYNTISKPSEIVAAAAADVAVGLLGGGEAPKADDMLFDTPTKLFTPTLVTAENLKAEIVDKMIDGKPIEPAAVLCTGRYAEGCKKLGIMP